MEEEESKRIFELKKEEELRFESDWNENLEIEVCFFGAIVKMHS